MDLKNLLISDKDLDNWIIMGNESCDVIIKKLL